MKKTILLAALCLSLQGAFINSSVFGGQLPQTESKVPIIKPMILTGTPIELGFAVVTKFEDKNLFTCSILNNSGKRIDAMQIGLWVYDAKGNPVGGEGWREKVDLAGLTETKFTRKMATPVKPGEFVVVTIDDIEGEEGTWSVPFINPKVALTAEGFRPAASFKPNLPTFAK